MHRAAYFELDDRLCFVEFFGDADAQPLLCVHTAGQSGVQFRHAAQGLADLGFQVLVPDLPGHGRSEPAVGGPIDDLGWYGDWCLRVLDHFGLTRPYLIGCSIGGSIVMDIATKASPSLAGVVAMAAADPHTMPFRRGRKNDLEDANSPSIRDRTYFGGLESSGRRVSPERKEMIALMHCREDWHVTFSDGSAMGQLQLWEKLPSIVCPMVVIAGEDDPFTNPSRIEETAARIPGAHYEMLEGVGHYPMEDLAEEFPAQFAQWLDIMRAMPSAVDAAGRQ